MGIPGKSGIDWVEPLRKGQVTYSLFCTNPNYYYFVNDAHFVLSHRRGKFLTNYLVPKEKARNFWGICSHVVFLLSFLSFFIMGESLFSAWGLQGVLWGICVFIFNFLVLIKDSRVSLKLRYKKLSFPRWVNIFQSQLAFWTMVIRFKWGSHANEPLLDILSVIRTHANVGFKIMSWHIVGIWNSRVPDTTIHLNWIETIPKNIASVLHMCPVLTLLLFPEHYSLTIFISYMLY